MTANLKVNNFKFVGGHISLDFVNTASGWSSNPTKKGERDYCDIALGDKLDDYADLVAWSKHIGLLTEKEAKNFLRIADEQPKAAEAIFKRGLKLREAIYRLFKSVIEKWKPNAVDVETLDEELSIAATHEKLIYSQDGFSWIFQNRSESFDCMLWSLAQSAAEVLTVEDSSRLRQCVSNGCGWMFLDTSRNRSRQWCDMKDCGNVAKVRRFRQKQKQ